jgi:hypothetical protein
LRDAARSLGSVTRAGDGASVDVTDEARDDGFSAGDEAWVCRSSSPIAQECRANAINAISLNVVGD